MSNNISGPFIFDNGVGTPVLPGGYLGFGQINLQSPDSSGPRLYAGVGNPNGILTAPIGSLWIESVTGVLYQNVDGAMTWNPITGGGSGGWDTIYDSGFIAAPAVSMDTGVLVIPAGSVHLHYVLLSRLTDAATYEHLNAALNADAVAANYIQLRSLGDPAVGVLTSPIDRAAASQIIGSTPAAGSAANRFGVLQGSVPFRAGTQRKQITGTSTDFRTAAGEEFVSTGAVEWANAAGVTQMTFTSAGGGSFAANSRLIVYAQ